MSNTVAPVAEAVDPIVQRDTDIAKRALPGVLGNLVMVQLILLSGTIFRDHPLVASTFALVAMSGSILRLFLVIRKNTIYSRGPRRWGIAFGAGLAASSAAWGFLCAFTIVNYGPLTWNSLFLKLTVLGLTAGALTSFRPRLSYLVWHLLPILVPCIAADLYLGQEGYAVALSTGAYATFLLIQGRHLNTDYWKSLHDRNQLACAKKMAESADEAKTNFLANMSHELRTPMNGIIGMTELALDTNLSNEQRELLDTAHNSAQSLLGLLNEILDFSTIEAHKVDLESAPFNLTRLLQEITKTYTQQVGQKGLMLTLNISRGVPVEIVGDSVRLRQVLFNLLGNAVKFTDAGGIELRVDVESENSEKIRLHFSVSDTGIGIPRDKQEVIFQPFSQADGSMTRKYGGTGLGLTISARLVQLMEGNIWVASEPGEGSIFHFNAQFGLVSSAMGSEQNQSLTVTR